MLESASMASPGLHKSSSILDPTKPVILYIAAPLALWAFRLIVWPILTHAPSQTIARGVGTLIGFTLIPFLLAAYAASIRRTRDWHSFSQWFGAWLLLYPLLRPLSGTLALFEVFEIAKRRVRNRQPKQSGSAS